MEPIERIVSEFSEAWRAAGVKKGDVLIVHSDVRSLLIKAKQRNSNFSPNDIVDSFIESVGPTGTILLPAFNFNVRNGVVFDIRNTPSDMGAITECLRKRYGSIRTQHPFLSFVVIGREAQRFAELDDYTGCGANSPFALVHHLAGKIGVLGLLDNSSMSMYHYVELALGVNNRLILDLEIEYIDWEGNGTMRVVGHYGRDIRNGYITNVEPAGEELWRRGLYSGERPCEGLGFRTVSAIDLYNATANIINEGRAEGMLFTMQR